MSAVALVVAAGCQRTPPEPSPAKTTQATPRAASAAPVAAPPPAVASAPPAPSGSRCVASWPDKAPAAAPPLMPGQCPKDPEGQGKLERVSVVFPEAKGLRVDAELVTEPAQIERGLMYRLTMPEDAGMLFRLAERKDHTFWMHNTCMSLDMLFVEDDGLIAGIVERATPLTDTIRSVGCPSKWVLEVNAGWARRHGVKPGQRLTIPSRARR